MLPDGEGFHWCSEYRKQGAVQIPVIFLTHRGSLSDKARAFNGGADDYMTKPFDPVELELRVKARLRSAFGTHQEQSIQCGDLILNVPYQKAVLNESGSEKDLRLTPTEFRLLYFFIKNENTILTRDQLLSTIWSDDVHVLTRTIDKHISTLKKKLGNRSNAIQSVHSRGYRFAQIRPGKHDSQTSSYVSMLSQ
jgi:DNA-binding response OmpR family regulator